MTVGVLVLLYHLFR